MKRSVFTNCHIFIGDGQIINNATVEVTGETISRVTTDHGSIPKDAESIDLQGGWLLPGFIDTHVHLCMDGSADMGSVHAGTRELTRLASKFAKQTLLCGVTTVRDLGGVGTIVQTVRDNVNSGLIPGPRILTAGRMICITGGHGHTLGARQADGPDEISKAVRKEIKAGADVIKLMSTGGVLTSGTRPGEAQMSLEELKAGVSEANRLGKRTAAHAQGSEGILNALKAGIDTIEHGYNLNKECIDLMQANGTILVPTCAPSHHMTTKGVAAGLAQEAFDKATRCMEAKQESFRLALDTNILMAAGSDAGTPFNYHGNNLIEETLMVQRGMTTIQALMSGTSIAARALGLDDSIGYIKPGYIADLVAVDGDPSNDIEVLCDQNAIRMVMRNGVIHKLLPSTT